MGDRRRGDYVISTDQARLDFDVIHDYLTQSYWSPGIPRATVERAARNSMAFGVYYVPAAGDARSDNWEQVGFGRVITDRTTFAYLADVFVLEAHRGRGLGVWLVETISAHPELQGLRRWVLATRDAHGLYARFGFTPVKEPARWMERVDREVYGRRTS